MGATERIIQYLNYKNITKYRFCKTLGLSSKFLDNSSNIGSDKACKILQHYTDINALWLITGEGEMLCNTQRSSSPHHHNQDKRIEKLEEEIKELKLDKQDLRNTISAKDEIIEGLKENLESRQNTTMAS